MVDFVDHVKVLSYGLTRGLRAIKYNKLTVNFFFLNLFYYYKITLACAAQSPLNSIRLILLLLLQMLPSGEIPPKPLLYSAVPFPSNHKSALNKFLWNLINFYTSSQEKILFYRFTQSTMKRDQKIYSKNL